MIARSEETPSVHRNGEPVATKLLRIAEKACKEPRFKFTSLFHLMKAFQEVMVHYEAADVREIELEEYTIEEKIEAVTNAIRERDQVLFTDLFADVSSRMELIVTFMAILEMIKHGHIKSKQEGAFSSIWIYAGLNFGQKLESVEGWFEATSGSEDTLTKVSHTATTDARLAETPDDQTETESDENGRAEPR